MPVILASVSAVGISIGAISAEPPRARRNDASAGWDSARANRHRKDRTATEPSSKVGEASQPAKLLFSKKELASIGKAMAIDFYPRGRRPAKACWTRPPSKFIKAT